MKQKSLLFCAVLTITTLLGGPAAHAGAQIIGVYENCRFANVTVFVSDRDVPGNVNLEAEIAAAGTDSFDAATAAAKQVLSSYGIKQVFVERRGYENCSTPTSGRFVQALGHYCEGHLVRAEVLVDGRIFAKRSDKQLTFEDFVERQRRRLRAQGIFEEPRITVQTAENCEQPKNS